MDFTGKAVATKICSSGNACNFDLTTLPEGCYFIRIKTSTESIVRKLVITR
jgi:hypothetical protein